MDLIGRLSSFSLLILLLACSVDNKMILESAWDQYEQNQFQECLETLNQIEGEYCEKTELKGHSYWSLKMFGQAITEYQKHINSCEGNLTVFNNLGDSFFKLEQGDSAYLYFVKAFEIDSSNQTVNFNLGMIHYTSSYDEDAKIYFRKAISASDSINLDYHEMLIKTYSSLDQYDSSFLIVDELLKQLNSATKLNRVKLNKAIIYGEMGKHEQLIDEIKTLIPNITDTINLFNAHHNMALSYYALEDSIEYCKSYNLARALRSDIEIPKYYQCK